MKKLVSLLLSAMLILSLSACGGAAAPSTDPVDVNTVPVDVDLTQLSSTMVYSEVYNMMMEPESYEGKTIKMNGMLDIYEGVSDTYFACVIADATACCAQGLEFVLKDSYHYPEDYPDAGTSVTVAGTFTVVTEGQYRFIQIQDADIVY